MAAQSGIAPTAELSQEWSTFLSTPSQRLFKITIEDEQLQPAGPWSIEAGEADEELAKVLALFEQEGVTDDKLPAYYVLRLSSTKSDSFLFVSYVPDHAQVRSKMLYASTRTTLIRSLGDSKFTDSIFATCRDDLSYKSYLAHTRHSSASAPLTAREQEMADIRQAESQAANDTEQQSQGRSIIYGQQRGSESEDGGKGAEVRGALPWSEEAKEAVRRLKEEGSKEVVQLEIDLKTESVVLSEPQPDSLSVPSDKPCYLFYRHSAGIVLIYSCPPKSPIKSRLVYSSAVLVFYKYAAKEYAGVEVLKKLETDDPSEVTLDWINSELGSLAVPSNSTQEGEGGSGASTPGGGSAPMPKEEKGFARPSRPGGKRR